MEYQHITVAQDDQIVLITINRPESLNALNVRVLQELHDFFTGGYQLSADCKAAILTGSGSKAFAAGADITEIASLNKGEGLDFAKRGHETMNAIENFPLPVIAAINGYALGGGCELALACHIRIASDNARLGLPEVGLGLIPGYGGTQRMVHIAGKGNAMYLVLTGKPVDAQGALRMGLVSRVVAHDEVVRAAKEIAKEIGTKGPLAIRKAMESINAALDPLAGGYEEELKNFGALIDSADAREGTAAFMEKRKPEFKGS